MPQIFVDADGCPVKQEVYRVARRYALAVTLVSNAWLRIPDEDGITQVVVGRAPDAADDWIAEHAAANDIVISADIPLASRCMDKGALVLDPRGHLFTAEHICQALAMRDLNAHLRDIGALAGGPAPFEKRHRSQFLQRLDQAVQSAVRNT